MVLPKLPHTYQRWFFPGIWSILQPHLVLPISMAVKREIKREDLKSRKFRSNYRSWKMTITAMVCPKLSGPTPAQPKIKDKLFAQ